MRSILLLGAHLDSTHAATGATDNATGSGAVMEALRILAAARVKPRRTIRVALWGGEEQGLLGSRAYVRAHFADKETMQRTHSNMDFFDRVQRDDMVQHATVLASIAYQAAMEEAPLPRKLPPPPSKATR